jgi:hypothetical protein
VPDRPRWAPLEGERVDIAGERGIRVQGTVERAYYVPPAFITAGHWLVHVRLDEQPLETEPEGAA